ncbi:DUF2157 domain-containing protein [Paradesertivirga mongoliensis]|uniref:DUF2157 domain-containing protein n=1 Tax=Paradesertivirga mongoliensis TaxID=2100740 RepID=A0ABW4ZG00_9SPHI
MRKLNLDQQEADFLNQTIQHWESEGLVTPDTAEQLRESYSIKQFDWRRLAQYSFWIALACGLIAFASLIINDEILKLLQKLSDAPDIVISVISALIAAWLYYHGQKSKLKFPEKIFSNEATLFVAVLFTASSIAFLGKAIDKGSGHFSMLFLLSVIVYGALALKFKSRLIWAFALISLGSWFGTETGYQTAWRDYFLKMNYPLRFVFFGAFITLAGYHLNRLKALEMFRNLTYIIGLLYLFGSLWLLSIFGNFGNLEDWFRVKQTDIFYYAIISAIVSAAFIAFGLKKKDEIAREFGITFLLVNIYTRYFEYFWNTTDKAIFFGILALSFWLIGRKAEKIWNLELFKLKQ